MGLSLVDYIYMITGMFGTYITYRYMRVFFGERRTSGKVEFISYIIYFIVMTIIYLSLSIPILNLISTVFFYFILSLNYKSSIRKRIISIIFIYMIFASMETIVAVISGHLYPSVFIQNLHYSSILGMVTLRILSFLVVLILGNFKNMKEGMDIPATYWISIFLMPLGSLFILLMLLQNYRLHTLSIVTAIIILFLINIIAFYLYDTLNKLFQDKIEKRALVDQNKYYQVQLETINESHKNIKSLRHDMRNHLAVLRSYIQMNEKENAINYITKIKDIDHGTKEFSRTENMDIDSILNYKLNEADAKGIAVSIKSKVPPKLDMESLDIVVILGNLLDNAIEASDKVENDKRIDLRIAHKKEALFIFIKNTFNGVIKYEDGKIKTTKMDSENHGIGLNNIEEILKKYNGTMKINHSGNNFTVEIVMHVD